MKTFISILMGGLLIMAIPACKKDANKDNGVNYRMGTTNRSSTLGTATSGDLNGSARETGTAGTITWTSGFANATTLKFEGEGASGETEFRSNISSHVDLFAQAATLGNIAVPPGTYHEVELKVSLAPMNGEPALELRGNYNGAPIVFQVQNAFDVEVEAHDITINANDSYTTLINLNLARLTNNISATLLAAATVTNGTIVISSSSNVALYNSILANLANCEEFEFEED